MQIMCEVHKVRQMQLTAEKRHEQDGINKTYERKNTEPKWVKFQSLASVHLFRWSRANALPSLVLTSVSCLCRGLQGCRNPSCVPQEAHDPLRLNGPSVCILRATCALNTELVSFDRSRRCKCRHSPCTAPISLHSSTLSFKCHCSDQYHTIADVQPPWSWAARVLFVWLE